MEDEKYIYDVKSIYNDGEKPHQDMLRYDRGEVISENDGVFTIVSEKVTINRWRSFGFGVLNIRKVDTKKDTEKIGVCENCRDEYDNPQPTKLYKINREWVCGDCANTWQHEREEYISAYGED